MTMRIFSGIASRSKARILLHIHFVPHSGSSVWRPILAGCGAVIKKNGRMNSKNMSEFYNKTRRSASVPAKLMREGKWYLLPVYYFMLTSYLAREGVANSGSYQFADHIYANQPRGSFFVGKVLDAILLNLKSA